MFIKRIFIILLLLCVSAVLFAEEGGKKSNSVSVDLYPLVKGFIATDSGNSTYFICFTLGYERLILPRFTIGANADFFIGSVNNISYLYFGVSGVGRYYLMSENAEKFFLGASLGFNTQSMNNNNFTGITAGLSAGYRIMIKSIYIEPSISYVLSKTRAINFSGASVVPLGWQGGLRFGFSF
ncbi:MAG: autotransporter outer membrane beta-barrel domain-containing protein [Treponema sp.]|nr:autotransporter outer membrane beta-barrel domain-containing protein [Treponema sp.]